ncbi:hypothetical protein V6D40_10130 [Corynebacterium sp. Q4381]|uniref:hypothetical protein n=1 Tax=Corynebacterium sp. Marseille-Q4381 TaxID=3121597 RepID=UPI002FE5C49F
MAARLYPLAPSVWGAALQLPVRDVVQAALFSEFAAHPGTAFVPVHLQAEPLSGGWKVRHANGAALGTLPARERERFEDLRRVEASLLMPVTLAEVYLSPETGRFEVNVLLPPPELIVPRNDAPPTAVVLQPGDMLVVDTSRGEFSAEELAVRSPGQWLVALHPIGGAVAATLGGKVLGGVEWEGDPTELVGDGQSEVYARAVVLDGMAALDVAPELPAAHVPALKVPDPRPVTPWELTDFPDGTWAVTVLRQYSVDEADTLRPAHTSRYVSLSGEDRPDDVAAPTEMFHTVDLPEPERKRATPIASVQTAAEVKDVEAAGEFLTEVEKVRLRRQARLSRRGGRHRK